MFHFSPFAPANTGTSKKQVLFVPVFVENNSSNNDQLAFRRCWLLVCLYKFYVPVFRETGTYFVPACRNRHFGVCCANTFLDGNGTTMVDESTLNLTVILHGIT